VQRFADQRAPPCHGCAQSPRRVKAEAREHLVPQLGQMQIAPVARIRPVTHDLRRDGGRTVAEHDTRLARNRASSISRVSRSAVKPARCQSETSSPCMATRVSESSLPYEVEQGICSAEQGIVSTEQGSGANEAANFRCSRLRLTRPGGRGAQGGAALRTCAVGNVNRRSGPNRAPSRDPGAVVRHRPAPPSASEAVASKLSDEASPMAALPR
jgi:hypothetical protein